MTDPRLRIGIIGAGRFAQEHIERLGRNPEAEIVAICDVSEENLRLAKERQPEALAAAAVYLDYQALLKAAQPDAVVICSPHHAHHAQAIASLEAGAHVLTEKPLANTLDEAAEIVERIAAAERVFGVAFQRHTWSDVRFVKALIETGKYGSIQGVTACQQEAWQAANVGTWRQDPRLSGGGYLHDGGSHLLDLILWTTNLTPRRVAAFRDTRGTEADVNTVLNIQFAEGGMATAATIGGCGRKWRQEITICCDHATITLDIAAGISIAEAEGDVVTPGPEEKPAGTDVDTNFIHAIRGREPVVASPAWAVKVMQLIEAIGRSAQADGMAVNVKPL